MALPLPAFKFMYMLWILFIYMQNDKKLKGGKRGKKRNVQPF